VIDNINYKPLESKITDYVKDESFREKYTLFVKSTWRESDIEAMLGESSDKKIVDIRDICKSDNFGINLKAVCDRTEDFGLGKSPMWELTGCCVPRQQKCELPARYNNLIMNI